MLKAEDKKIAKNSLALYVQMFFGMLVGFYTSRVVLDVLGIDDFGLYNVVGGVVAMFTILNSAMSSSSSRFLTYELGTGDKERLKQVFGVTMFIHLGIALIIAVLAVPIGLWFMSTKMQIDLGRMYAAELVFYASVLSTCLTVVMVPFQATIIAHEKMSIYVYFSMVDLLTKLGIVIILPFVAGDKLVVYAFMLLGLHFIMQFSYIVYCRRHFVETRGNLSLDRGLMKEMSSFAGWSLFGDSAVLMMTQGLNILLNVFFGAGVNAARGIAVQVQSVLARFVGGFQTALNPQIIKRYAAKELEEMHRLIYASSRYSFYVMLIVVIPIFLELDEVLNWWLKQVPEHTASFLRIMIVISLIECLANPLIFAAKATGKIKKYQAILGGLLLLVVPFSYCFLTLGYPPESVFIVHLVITLLGHVVRVVLISGMVSLSINSYLNKVVIPCLVVAILGALFPYFWKSLFPNSSTIIFFVFSFLWGFFMVFFIGLKQIERKYALVFFRDRLFL
ncbi:MAG: hypothetical protein LBE37_01620 [Sphingobacterium sp.]|jgi:O-antigen/teichoic acid export membrane protein|nr:hypothetical protein [Sphingobacterium sp.]